MARGRRPVPTALRIIRDLPATKKSVLDSFEPASVIPAKPKHLTGEAAAEWKRVTAELAMYGVIAKVDRAALSMLCCLWKRHTDAEAMILELMERDKESRGLFQRSPNGYMQVSPFVSISNAAIQQYRMLCSEFGLTPAARARIKTNGGPSAAVPVAPAGGDDDIDPMLELINSPGRPT